MLLSDSYRVRVIKWEILCQYEQVETSSAGEDETLAMLRKKEEDGDCYDNETNAKECWEVREEGKNEGRK